MSDNTETLVERLRNPSFIFNHHSNEGFLDEEATVADMLEAAAVLEAAKARPGIEWHEDDGDVLWWRFPVDEAPWVGSPLAYDWPGYHTHWTPLPPIPVTPAEASR